MLSPKLIQITFSFERGLKAKAAQTAIDQKKDMYHRRSTSAYDTIQQLSFQDKILVKNFSSPSIFEILY